VISARPDDPQLDAAFIMLDDVIRHVPLVDEDGTVTGMVSMRDLLPPLLAEAAGR
jgi:CBS domain-containing protein